MHVRCSSSWSRERSFPTGWRRVQSTWKRRSLTFAPTRSGWAERWEFRRSNRMGGVAGQNMKQIFVFLALMATAIACAAQGATPPVIFQPGTDLQKRALSPSPGGNAVKKAAIGRGKIAIDTGDPKNTAWTETIDVSGAGNVVNADMLWDSSSKILYAFAHTTLRCTHGKTLESDILVGLYGKKNFLGKVAGSGWWVVELQQGQC